jgi:hypothetical protein
MTARLSEAAMWIFCATVTSTFVILLLSAKSSTNSYYHYGLSVTLVVNILLQ